jgi:ubiquinone/menaquinone biosynthesis C-methylase UbiE
MSARGGWNHNSHFHDYLLQRIPASPRRALDIGCGDGAFAARLARRCDEVVALDADPSQVAATRARCSDQPNVVVREGNFLQTPLPTDGFDLVTALAVLHHLDFDAAADQIKRVLAPGGTLAVLGVCTNARTPADLAWTLCSTPAHWWWRLRRGDVVMTAPAIPPTMTLSEVRAKVGSHFPAAVVRRHLLWRYTLIWRKPTDP